MSDRESKFVITVEGDAAGLTTFLSGVRTQFKSATTEIEAQANKIEFFKGAEAKFAALADNFIKTSKAAQELRDKVDQVRTTFGTVGDDLAKQLTAAEKASLAAANAYQRQANVVVTLQAGLKTAGVNTAALASEEARLAAAIAVANKAATDQAASQALGIRTLKDVTPEIQKLQAAYNTLRTSGTLSVKELALAQDQLRNKVADLRASVTQVSLVAKESGPDLAAFFSRSILPALGLTGGVLGVVSALKSAAQAVKEFDQGVAEIGTVTNLSKEQLDALGAGARQLAVDLGVDVSAALNGVFELIRSGVPADNALEVLRAAAEASKAAVTDLGSGVKAANVLISAFGVPVNDVARALDAVIQGAKDGGATLKEFGDNAAPLLNVAKAANIPLNELVATLTVMTNATGNAEQSIGDLTKIIAKFDTTEARKKLHDLGIEGDGLVSTFQQLGAKGLGLNEILDLGVASVKAAAGVASLTNNSAALSPELDKVAASAGAAAKNTEALFDSPKERSERFNAQLNEASINVGKLVGSGSFLQGVATDLLAAFNSVGPSLDRVSVAMKKSNTNAGDVAKAFFVVGTAALDNADKNDRLAASLNRISIEGGEKLKASLEKSAKELTALSTALLAEVQAFQTAATRDVADLQARADAQIAALDRSAKATAATAEATLAIQTKLASDRLAIIKKNEADVTDAVEKAVAARTAVARKAGVDEKKIAQDNAQTRIDALAPVLAQYQAHYNALLAQSQAYASKFQSIELERVDFNRGIEKTLFDIRLSGLDSFDQYLAKAKEVDRLISESRKAGLEGDLASAKRFTDDAIALAGQLRSVTDANGVKVISDLQAQTQSTDLVKKAAAGYNDTLRGQADAAKAGSDATKKGIDDVLPKLRALQADYDKLKETVAEGLLLKAVLDDKSVAAALATINELTRDREVHIKIIEDRPGTAPDVTAPPTGPTGQPLARGGFAGFPIPGITGNPAFAQAFARGGPVFSRPTWNKVPGIGNADTIPAALQAGSFVVKQSASRYYGDGLMAKVAGFASGGTVTKDEVRQFAEKTFGYDPFGSQFGLNDRSSGVAPSSGLPDAPSINPKTGFKSGDSFQNDLLSTPFSLDSRPIPEALLTAANVIAYAREMLNSVGQTNPLLGSLLPAILNGIRAVQRNPNDQNALKALLTAAETIGANPYLFEMWGKTTGVTGGDQLKPEWFIDWLRLRGFVDATGTAQGAAKGVGGSSPLPVGDFARRFFSQAIPHAGDPRARIFGSQSPLIRALGAPEISPLFHRFAGGGRASITGGNVSADTGGSDVTGATLSDGLGEIMAALQFFVDRSGLGFVVNTPGGEGTSNSAVVDSMTEVMTAVQRIIKANGFSAGGGTSDTVPAMLTPGEWVVNAPRARQLGAGVMNAINSMAVPRDTLANMLANGGLVAPRPPAYFADGGPVGHFERAGGAPGTPEAGGRGPLTVNVNANAGDLLSPDNVRRFIVPVINEIDRRGR